MRKAARAIADDGRFRSSAVWLACALALLLWALPASAQPNPADSETLKTIYEMYADYREEFPEVPDITAQEVMALLKQDKVVLVDIREPEEQEVSMLPGALTEDEFLAGLGKHRDKTVVAYCTISYRSGKFASKMRKKGLDMYNLKGGLLAWVGEGGKVHDKNGQTKRIHVYGRRWNHPPQGYEAVW